MSEELPIVYLARHGETAWSLTGQHKGLTNLPLTEAGERNASRLFVWGELSEKFKTLNDARFGGLKQWLTDRYDNPKVPDAIGYRQTQKKNQNTPPITFEQAPRINILATRSEEWFFNNLAHEDSAGGFLPRWTLVRAVGADKIIPTPLVPDPKLLPGLAPPQD